MSYKKDWADAKVEFLKLTGQKKPREKVLKFFDNSHTGLSSSLQAIDEFFKKYGKNGPPSAFKGLNATFLACSVKYRSMLDRLIDELERSRELDTSKDKMKAGLTFLEAKLKSFESDFKDYQQQREVYAAKFIKLAEVIDTKWALDLSKLKKALAHYDAAHALEEVAKKRKAPDAAGLVDVWNKEVRPVAREIAAALRGCSEALNMAIEVNRENDAQAKIEAYLEHEKAKTHLITVDRKEQKMRECDAAANAIDDPDEVHDEKTAQQWLDSMRRNVGKLRTELELR